jgi:hypothetical protein
MQIKVILVDFYYNVCDKSMNFREREEEDWCVSGEV